MNGKPLDEKVVERYYDAWTQKYMDDFGQIFQALQTENPEELIEYIARVTGMHDGQKILDAGCGIGGPAVIWAKKYAVEIEALTISTKQVELAKAAVKDALDLKGRISVTKGDFHQLESYFGENTFDTIYFLESLVHSHNPALAISSARRVIKDQGILYIKDLFKGPSDPNSPGMIDYPIARIDEQFALKIRTVGEILNIIAESGFMIDYCRQPEVQNYFDRGNRFTAKHLFSLLPEQKGPWMDEGLTFLHWLEIKATKRY